MTKLHELIPLIEQCDHRSFRLDDMRLNAKSFGELGQAFSKTNIITQLTFCNCTLEQDVNSQIISNCLAQCSNLQTLDVFQFHEGGEVLFMGSLSSCLPNLRNFSFGTSDFSDLSATTLSTCLSNFSHLKKLELVGGAVLSKEGLQVLAKAFQKCLQLSELRIIHIRLPEEAFSFFANAITHMPCLQTLLLCKDNISKANVTALSSALPLCQKLAELNLARNEFGDEGALNLAAVVPNCSKLKELNLNKCQLSDEGVIALANALRNCSSPMLESLHLSENPITDNGAMVLASTLPFCSRLINLHLVATQAKDEGALALSDVLGQCQRNCRVIIEGRERVLSNRPCLRIVTETLPYEGKY